MSKNFFNFIVSIERNQNNAQAKVNRVGRERVKGQLAIVLRSKKINKGVLFFFFFLL